MPFPLRSRMSLSQDGINPDKISIAYSGVDVNRFQGDNGGYIPGNSRFLPDTHPWKCGLLGGGQGPGIPYPGHGASVEMNPEVRLFILGTGKLESHSKALTRALNLERNIIFAGFRNDVGAFLKTINMLVVSSIEEGLNSTILDALALEVPVVATDAGGVPEIIRNEASEFWFPESTLKPWQQESFEC